MSRLLVALTLFCSGATLMAAAQELPTIAHTYEHKLSDEELALIKLSQTQQKMQAGEIDPLYKINVDEFLNKQKLEAAKREAKVVADEIAQHRAKAPMLDANFEPVQNQPEPKPYTDHNVLVFASTSLGKQGLQDLLEMAAGHEDVVVVFRGIHQHETMSQAMLRIRSYLEDMESKPNIVIDPTLYRSYKIDAVPSIVIIDPQNLPLDGDEALPIAQVDGLSDPAWLKKAVERGEDGNHGVKGPLEPIAEVDLIELAKHRASQIDWEHKKEQAIKNFWFKQRFLALDKAPQSRTRYIDPSVVITKDVKTPDGKVVLREGDVYNPLKIRAFTQAVVVFDPLDKEQIQLVQQEVASLKQRSDIAFITYIATQMDRDGGWDAYNEVSDIFDEHIYLLTPDVAARFELEFVPAVITSAVEAFSVKELARPRMIEPAQELTND